LLLLLLLLRLLLRLLLLLLLKATNGSLSERKYSLSIAGARMYVS